MSNRLSPRPQKRAPIIIKRLPDGGYLLTACAPRDGAGRETSAADLHYPMTAAEFSAWVDSLVYLRAGT